MYVKIAIFHIHGFDVEVYVLPMMYRIVIELGTLYGCANVCLSALENCHYSYMYLVLKICAVHYDVTLT